MPKKPGLETWESVLKLSKLILAPVVKLAIVVDWRRVERGFGPKRWRTVELLEHLVLDLSLDLIVPQSLRVLGAKCLVVNHLQKYHFIEQSSYITPTTPSASPRTGTRLSRPDPGPHEDKESNVGSLLNRWSCCTLAYGRWVPQLDASSDLATFSVGSPISFLFLR